MADVSALTVYVVFATLFLAFFVIMPGIKNEKATTLGLVMLTLFMGGSNLVVIRGCNWHVGEAEISTAYRSFSNEKFHGKIGVYIGLSQINVTLMAKQEVYNQFMDMDYNEQFVMEGPDKLKEGLKNGLKKGLPYPILTVAEYMAQDAGSFSWGRNYRQAGYFCCICLWLSFALWLLMNIMIVQIPRYGAYLMTASGVMSLFSDFIYWCLLPPNALKIPFAGVVLEFKLGWCFWLALSNGILCVVFGFGIIIFDFWNPDKFKTILEIDYETPFDRNTIIQDSKGIKNKKKLKLTDAAVGNPTIWNRFSRRFSKKHENSEAADQYAFYYVDGVASPWRLEQVPKNQSNKEDTKVLNLSGVQTPCKSENPGEENGNSGVCTNFEYSPSKLEKTLNLSGVPTPCESENPGEVAGNPAEENGNSGVCTNFEHSPSKSEKTEANVNNNSL